MIQSRFAIFLAIPLVLFTGCGPSSSPTPPAPTLTVTIDGTPAAGLQVFLTGADGKPVASGTTDASGKTTLRAGDSNPPPSGSYKLIVADASEVEENPMEVTKAAHKIRVAAIYTKAKTSTASVNIDSPTGSYTVDLKSK